MNLPKELIISVLENAHRWVTEVQLDRTRIMYRIATYWRDSYDDFNEGSTYRGVLLDYDSEQPPNIVKVVECSTALFEIKVSSLPKVIDGLPYGILN